jgi:hypothetical protein
MATMTMTMNMTHSPAGARSSVVSRLTLEPGRRTHRTPARCRTRATPTRSSALRVTCHTRHRRVRHRHCSQRAALPSRSTWRRPRGTRPRSARRARGSAGSARAPRGAAASGAPTAQLSRACSRLRTTHRWWRCARGGAASAGMRTCSEGRSQLRRKTGCRSRCRRRRSCWRLLRPLRARSAVVMGAVGLTARLLAAAAAWIARGGRGAGRRGAGRRGHAGLRARGGSHCCCWHRRRPPRGPRAARPQTCGTCGGGHTC